MPLPMLLIAVQLAYLRAVDHLTAAPQRLQVAWEDKERGDGGPIPTAVIIVGVIAAAAFVVLAITAAVRKHAAGIK